VYARAFDQRGHPGKGPIETHRATKFECCRLSAIAHARVDDKRLGVERELKVQNARRPKRR